MRHNIYLFMAHDMAIGHVNHEDRVPNYNAMASYETLKKGSH